MGSTLIIKLRFEMAIRGKKIITQGRGQLERKKCAKMKIFSGVGPKF